MKISIDNDFDLKWYLTYFHTFTVPEDVNAFYLHKIAGHRCCINILKYYNELFLEIDFRHDPFYLTWCLPVNEYIDIAKNFGFSISYDSIYLSRKDYFGERNENRFIESLLQSLQSVGYIENKYGLK